MTFIAEFASMMQLMHPCVISAIALFLAALLAERLLEVVMRRSCRVHTQRVLGQKCCTRCEQG